MSLNKTIATRQIVRELPLPYSHDLTEAIDQAKAALILHTDETQRAALITAELRLLSESDLAVLLVDLSKRHVAAGGPLPAFINLREEAAEWANFATRAELRAYCGACLRALPETDVKVLSVALARRTST